MNMCATLSWMAASCRRRRQQLMKHVIINASCLLIICTAASATAAGPMPLTSTTTTIITTRSSISRASSISADVTGAGNRPDNKQPQQQLAAAYRSLMLEREFYVHSHDKTLSTVKSDNDVKDFQSKHDDFRSGAARRKRSSSSPPYSGAGRISTNSNFNILNLSNKNLSDTRRLTQEIASYSQRQSNYEIGHYYNLSDISALDLSRNNLSEELPVQLQASFSALSWLDLSENKLSSAGLLAGIALTLQYLNLSCNRLASFDSSRLPHLTRLDLSSNAIANTSFLSPLVLPNLTDLDLGCNRLQSIDKSFFFYTRSLHRLDISGNGIRQLNQSVFYNLINLEHLNLAGNRIDVIENDTFSYLVNLQFLDLSHNDIGPGSIRALQGIPALIGLSLAYNSQLGPVMHEFVASWSLKELDASGIGLCHIPTALAQSVKSLKLANNLLSVIRSGDFDSYPLLQQLILSNNLILDIEDDALGRLELLSTLFLDQNRLVRVPISLPSNLNHLHLQHNAIYELQPAVFKSLKNLKTLNLEGNRIAYLPELPLPALAVLNVRSNDLKGLSQSVVKTSPNLRDFLLENNPVKCADLLGIAEWAKPCRDEMLFAEDQDSHRFSSNSDEDSGSKFEIFGRFTTGSRRCGDAKSSPPPLMAGYAVSSAKMASKIASFKSQCRNENLINLNAPKRLKNDQTAVKHSLVGDKIASAAPTAVLEEGGGGGSSNSTFHDATLVAYDTSAKIGAMNDDKPEDDVGAKNFTTNTAAVTATDNERIQVGAGAHSKSISSETKQPKNLNVNLSGESLGSSTTVPTVELLLQQNFHNNTIEDTKQDKVSTPRPAKEMMTTSTLASTNRTTNNDKLGNSSSVNRVINSQALTRIVPVAGSERAEAGDKSVTTSTLRPEATAPETETEKNNRNSLIQTDSTAATVRPSGRSNLLETTPTTTVTTMSSSTLTLTPTVKKYDEPVSVPVPPPVQPITPLTQTTTNGSASLASSFISNKNSSYRNDAVQTDDNGSGGGHGPTEKDNLKQNIPPPPTTTTPMRRSQKPPAKKAPSYNVTAAKARKNVNHMKMKLKFNHDQLHNDEFRDNFDIDSVVGPLEYGKGRDGEAAHRKPRKFSIYDSIYMASLKNANFKPLLHHSVHVPASSSNNYTSRTTTTLADGIGSDPQQHQRNIPATSGETSSKILPQEWNDVRPVSSGGSHYGLFIVVGATLGMLISFGLFHLYYCRVRLRRRRGQHLHGHHYHYRQAPDHYQRHGGGGGGGAEADGLGNDGSNHNSAHHRYSYAFEQDDSDERLTYTISTSVLDAPDENGVGSPIHHQQQQRQDVLHMDVLNPLKSKPLSRDPSTSSSGSSTSRNSATSSCIHGGSSSELRPMNCYEKYGSKRPNASNNRNRQNRPGPAAATIIHGDNAIDRW